MNDAATPARPPAHDDHNACGRPTVAFAMERHLGHRTYYENLRGHVDTTIVDPRWIHVDYDTHVALGRLGVPQSVVTAWSAHRITKTGLRRARADVHVFNTQVPAVLGGRTARSRPYIVITDVTPLQYDRVAEGYGHTPDTSGLLGRLKHRANLRMFRTAAHCVGWSTWVRDSLVDEYGVAPERAVVIPPGVDTQCWAPGPAPHSSMAPFRILFVGGDFERKGGADVLAAIRELPGVELTVVTKSDVPSDGRVRVVRDMVPNDPRLVQLYRESHAFVLPTRAETFGIAAVEAAATGVPVVASNLGGLRDIVVDGVTGLRVHPGVVSELVGALASLRDDPDRRAAMARAAREHALERFDARTNASRLVRLALDANAAAHV